MGDVYNSKDSKDYDRWFKKPQNRFISGLEKKLMLDMLRPARGETVLDIGCGTGESLIPFLESGLSVTGIDPSRHMLDCAMIKLGNRADFHCGFAEELPFDDNSFDFASFFTSLEFVNDPKKALEEACRVAKDKVFIGILNSHSINVFGMRVKGLFSGSVYRHANFYNIWEVKAIIKEILGDVPVSWETVYRFPMMPRAVARKLDETGFAKKYPFGTFAGIVVIPVPRFRTRPLGMYLAKPTTEAVAG
jgi:ubiquinone/menaquinone biosynthesis C-methylase UbiE